MSSAKQRAYQLWTVPKDMLPFQLESGEKLHELEVAYHTFGSLNEARSNAVLVLHAFSGDSNAMKWWYTMVGPGKPIDTDKYFVICSNVLGGCSGTTGPASINPQTNKPYGFSFPIPSIRDMVRVQALLLDHLNVKKLIAAIGGSMGGMQALEWAKTFPDRLKSSIVIASTTRLSPQNIGFHVVGRNAIMSDPNWNGGDYHEHGGPKKGLSIARMLGHITFLSEEAMYEKFGRKVRKHGRNSPLSFGEEHEVESYLWHQGSKFVERFDAATYLLLTKTMDYFDFSDGYNSLEEAFAASSCDFLIISFTSDWLFPTEQSRDMYRALLRAKKSVTFREIETNKGHDSFLLPNPEMEDLVRAYLEARR
jgi:homoserine O-acetyltransferase